VTTDGPPITIRHGGLPVPAVVKGRGLSRLSGIVTRCLVLPLAPPTSPSKV
jgi:hypothetical protein